MITIDYDSWIWYYNTFSGDKECPYDNVPLGNIDSKRMNKIFNCNNYVIDKKNNLIKLYEHERYPKKSTESKKHKKNKKLNIQ